VADASGLARSATSMATSFVVANRLVNDVGRTFSKKSFSNSSNDLPSCFASSPTKSLTPPRPGWSRLRDPTRLYRRLFTFLKYPQIEPTNNQAEQSLRYMVISRKICFGTRSYQGSLSHSVLPSLLVTAGRQGQHRLTFFETLFTSDTSTAMAAVCNGRCH